MDKEFENSPSERVWINLNGNQIGVTIRPDVVKLTERWKEKKWWKAMAINK